MRQLSTSKKRGCPTCDGVDPKSCMRCHGKTRLCEWWVGKYGWTWWPMELGEPEEAD